MRNWFLLLILGLLGAAGAMAQLPRSIVKEVYDPTRKSNTQLSVTPLLDQLPPSGFCPVRVYILNDAKIDRNWELNFTSSDSGYNDEGNELRSSFSITCEAKNDTEVDLLVPLVTAFQEGYSSTTELSVQVRAPAPLRNSNARLSTTFNENFPAVMVSEQLYLPNGTALSTEADSALSGRSSHGFGSHGYGGTSGIEFGAVFNPKQMSEDWRAYSGFDACLLTESDWDDFSPGTRLAFLKWVRLGGSLVIYTSSSGTDLRALNIDKSASQGAREGDLSWGTVRLLSLPASTLDATATVKMVMVDLYKRTGGNRLYNLRNEFRPDWPLQKAFGSKTAYIVFFILILIAFGILVGPINLFVFARAGQRHRLFITTPIISLSASLLLVILILFQDGFGGRGQRAILMEIGPDNSAYLSQEQIARTGVLLRTGFTTPEHGYLSPVMLADSRWARVTERNSGGEGRYTVDLLDSGMKVAGDWFQSRSEHGHLFETIRPTRGDVNVIRPGKDPVVNSTFEFPLETLYYLDPDGELWTAVNLQQGRNTTLQPATRPQFDLWLDGTRRDGEKYKFSSRNQLRIERLRNRTGSFFAVASQAPAIDTLSSINWNETHSFITGQVAPP